MIISFSCYKLDFGATKKVKGRANDVRMKAFYLAPPCALVLHKLLCFHAPAGSGFARGIRQPKNAPALAKESVAREGQRLPRKV
jgi:hypothetical protein